MSVTLNGTVIPSDPYIEKCIREKQEKQLPVEEWPELGLITVSDEVYGINVASIYSDGDIHVEESGLMRVVIMNGDGVGSPHRA